MKDSKNPETSSISYDVMTPAWQKVQTLLDGTKAMRAAGRTYMPQHHSESDDLYLERLQRCTLLNMTKLTLNNWVGRPFSKPIKFDDVAPVVEELFDDIDLLGNDIQVFCRDWFADGVAKAFSHCYVEFPRTDTGGVRTLEDDRVEGVRPHWIAMRPEQVFFVDVEVVNGAERLREVRIMEDVVERDGFAEFCQPQIRRVYVDPTGLVQVELWRLADPHKPERREWKVTDNYSISIPLIPLVTFYSHRAGLMLGTPPLEDLADLNIAHWQSSSEQRAILTVTRFPILAGSGVSNIDKNMVIGPNRLLTTADPAGRIYYVEHSGKSLEAGRLDLESLESSMAAYGAEYLKKKPNPTASARILDNAEATSPLQDMAMRFGHAVTQALEYTALWLRMESEAEVEVHTKFDDGNTDGNELTTLRETRKMKDISRDAYLNELQRRGVLGESFDMEDDALLLENEALSMDPGPLLDPEQDPEQQQPDDEQQQAPVKEEADAGTD